MRQFEFNRGEPVTPGEMTTAKFIRMRLMALMNLAPCLAVQDSPKEFLLLDRYRDNGDVESNMPMIVVDIMTTKGPRSVTPLSCLGTTQGNCLMIEDMAFEPYPRGSGSRL